MSRQRYATLADGTERVVMSYRCRKCGDYFDALELELNCRATPPRRGRKPEALRDKRVDEVLPEERISELQQQADAQSEVDLSSMTSEQRLEFLRKMVGGVVNLPKGGR